MFLALVGAYPITIVFGLPVFGLLYGRVGFGPWPPILAGFAIVMAGVTAIQALDHHVAADGYLMAATVGLLGAFGGWVFWIVAVWSDLPCLPRGTKPAPRFVPFERIRYVGANGVHDGLVVGSVGYIIDAHAGDAYEVEFSHPDGESYFLGAISGVDLEKVL